MSTSCIKPELYVERHGSGAPLLLIPGLGSDAQSWPTVLPRLAAHFEVIVFDHRGIGRTPLGNTPLSINGMAQDVLNLMNQLHLPSAHLLGHSMGGMIALECARLQPARVSSLSLVATAAHLTARNRHLLQYWSALRNNPTCPLRDWFKELLFWIFTPEFFENDIVLNASLDFLLAYAYLQSAESFKQQIQAIINYDARTVVPTLPPRTLILSGELDILFPPSHANPVLRQIPNHHLKTIPHAAHSIHMEQPEAWLQAVIPFLL